MMIKLFVIRSELQRFVGDGVLSRLFVSFSRDNRKEANPRYVQVRFIKVFSIQTVNSSFYPYA